MYNCVGGTLLKCSKPVNVTRQNCPRSPSRDFAAGPELFQRLACPALAPATCEITVAHVAFQCISPSRTQRKAKHISAASTASTSKSTILHKDSQGNHLGREKVSLRMILTPVHGLKPRRSTTDARLGDSDGHWVTAFNGFRWFSRLASVDLQNDNISEAVEVCHIQSVRA